MTPTQGSTTWGFPTATVFAFDEAYLLAQPDPVQAALSVTAGSSVFAAMSLTTAMALAKQGYFIDYPVMCSGWDPYVTMYQRQVDGYTTYPDATGTMTRPVSLNLSDYPAWHPTPVEPPPFVSLVGAATGTTYNNPGSPYNGWAIYSSNPGTNNSSINADMEYSLDPRGVFFKLVIPGIFGPTIEWVQQP